MFNDQKVNTHLEPRQGLLKPRLVRSPSLPESEKRQVLQVPCQEKERKGGMEGLEDPASFCALAAETIRRRL